MYPHIIIAFNIAPNCMIGKLMINTDIESLVKSLNDYEEEKYDAGKDFVDNLLIHNVATMGSKWFNLPNVCELDKMIRKEFNVKSKKIIEIDENDGQQYFLEDIKISI